MPNFSFHKLNSLIGDVKKWRIECYNNLIGVFLPIKITRDLGFYYIWTSETEYEKLDHKFLYSLNDNILTIKDFVNKRKLKVRLYETDI